MPAGQPDLLLRVSCICRREADGLKLRQPPVDAEQRTARREFFPAHRLERGLAASAGCSTSAPPMEEMNRDSTADQQYPGRRHLLRICETLC
ncbi:MAG: hypothetical protein ACLVL7_09680 [Anaerotruncus massiliensis (ex Togo et al. 2019)]